MQGICKSLILCQIIIVCLCASENYKITYEHLYKAGVDAYLQNRWYDCIAYVEKALEDYFYYQSIIIHCRSSCQKQEFFPVFKDSDEPKDRSLVFFEAVVKKALCLSKCDPAYFQNRTRPSKTTDKDFDGKVPYNYLQLCYYKTDDIQKAASCAYTFLIHNPKHEVMQTNLRFYIASLNEDQTKIQNLEVEDYQELYLQGAHLYTNEKHKESITVMEKSLQEYLLAERKCHLLCEGPMPEFFEADFYVSIANHFTYTLRCKLKCPNKLCQVYGQVHENMFSSHYHYLQFSYYKTGDLEKACQAVASYLHLHPNDETMLINKAYYSKLAGVQPAWFTPRSEAINYLKRSSQENSLLESVHKWFQTDEASQSEIKSYPTPPPGSNASFQASVFDRKFGKTNKLLSGFEIEKWLQEKDIVLHLKDKALNGTERVSFQNLASEGECSEMIDLANEGAVFGDGYNGRESPHTEFEMFEGLTLARAATLSQRGILNPEVVQLFINMSEKARMAVEKFFGLETELFFAYTHLVCRTAFSDSPDERMDLSHPVHADNCILTKEGDCLRQSPAYVWRDYSSIVYLNEDFEGGEFFFADDQMKTQATLKPNCGLMVAFSAGKENLHGVKAVKKGKRCALAMWYTLDPRHRERERDFASRVVSELIDKRRLLKSSASVLPSPGSYKEVILKRLMANDKPKKSVNHEHTEL